MPVSCESLMLKKDITIYSQQGKQVLIWCIPVSVVLYPISRVINPSFHLSQPSLTPPARDAHPVSYSFLFPADRKWLEPTDTHTGGRKWSHSSTCNQEIEQPQQGEKRPCMLTYTHTHTYIYTSKCLTHKHPLTSPTAVGTGTTTQETECEQSAQTHSRTSSMLKYYHCLFNLHTHRYYLRYQLVHIV